VNNVAGVISGTGSWGSYIARVYAYFLRNKPRWGARVTPVQLLWGIFYRRERSVVPSRGRWKEVERRRRGREVPEAAERKLDRGTVGGSSRSLPKTIAPTSGAIAGFIPTFCRVILFNARPTLLRLNYSNSVLRSFPGYPLVATLRARALRSTATSIRRFSPPDDFPPRFPPRCCCLYWSHIRVKGPVIAPGFTAVPTNAAHATRQHPNVAVQNGCVWAKTAVAVCTA